jgi:putative ABC transport system permease protein
VKLPLWRRRQDEELEEELAAHLRMAIADRIARGESPDEAARAARLEFGNLGIVKEATRETWGWIGLEQLAQDVRYAWRTLRRTPGFTIVAVITLALGIGANTAMFSVINAVLLRPLPFPSPAALVAVSSTDLRSGPARSISMSLSWPDFFDFRGKSHTFEHLSGYRDSSFTLVTSTGSVHVVGAIVTSEIFSTLGTPPAIGRGFRLEDERAGSDVAVIGDALWRSQFAAAPDIAGRTITLDSRPYTIVGVMPPAFQFPIKFPAAQIWITLAVDARVENPGDTPITEQRGAHFLKAIGRLRPSATVASAQADLDVVQAALAREFPVDNGQRGVRVTPQLDALVGDARGSLLVLLAAVGCVLLIACVNLANLLLARGAGRGAEIAMRKALGASARRIVRQLLTESLVLAAIGTACGLAVAYGSIAALVRWSPVDVRGLDQVALDATVLAFTAAIAFVSALAFGLAPALRAVREDAAPGAQTAARATAGRAERRLRGLLVVAETAIGVVLLVGAGLLLRSFDALVRTPAGFDPDHVVTATFLLPDTRYSYPRKVAFYDALLADLRALPGVEAAAATVPLPLSGTNYTISFEQAGGSSGANRESADFALISPGFLRAMHIPLVRGRDVTPADDDAAPRVVVVNEAFARVYFPGVDPIGKRLKLGISTTEAETPWREIVGVAGDVRSRSFRDPVRPAYFVPYAQGLISTLRLVVRARNTAGIGEEIRKLVASRDREVAVYDVKTMDQFLATSVASPRFQAVLLALFAIVGLMLTAVGLYGVLAYGVAQRTREFGIRLALGAPPGDVRRLVMRGGLTLVAAGLVLGILAAAFATDLLASALYGVNRLDPATFAAVAALLLAVAMLASYLPARRATRVDPIRALRAE